MSRKVDREAQIRSLKDGMDEAAESLTRTMAYLNEVMREFSEEVRKVEAQVAGLREVVQDLEKASDKHVSKISRVSRMLDQRSESFKRRSR